VTTVVVVDGPSLANDVGRYLAESAPSSATPEVQRAYFTNWFDIDRLVAATLGASLRLDPLKDLGVLIVHSHRGVGAPGTVYSVDDPKVAELFWARQGGAPGASTLLVNIKGTEGKGVTTEMVVYLFETLAQWDNAVIVSRDAEFVPAVWSLRRKGKRIFCAAPETELGSPLVQACHSFLPLDEDFIRADRALFEFLQPSGGLEQWLASDVVRAQPLTLLLEDGGLTLSPSFGEAGKAAMAEIIQPFELYASECDNGLQLRARGLPQLGDPELIPSGAHVFEGLRRYHFLFRSKRWHAQLRLGDQNAPSSASPPSR
jgi:hypothetical protein